MTIEEIKFKWEGQGKALSAAEIDFLLIELTCLRAELAEKEGEIERLEQQVCDACNGDGWIYNRVEGRGACVCMTEAEPFQILLNALERIAGGKCQTGASWSEAKEALRAVLPLDYE